MFNVFIRFYIYFMPVSSGRLSRLTMLKFSMGADACRWQKI